MSSLAVKPRAATGLPPIRTEMALAKADLAEHGVTRFHGAASEGEIAEARARLEDQAEAERKAGVAHFENGEGSTKQNSFGPNQRVRNLINKGEVFRRLAVNPAVGELMRSMMGEEILLSSYGANIVRKGGTLGAWHADQGYTPAETPYTLAANCLWMVTDFTKENGATRVIPGSHLWQAWPPLEGEFPGTVQGTGPSGTILIFDGRLWHGTGSSRVDEPRMGLLAYHCRPFVRQKENFSLAVSPEVLAGASDELKSMLGFKVWATLGGVFGPPHDGPIVDRPTRWIGEMHA